MKMTTTRTFTGLALATLMGVIMLYSVAPAHAQDRGDRRQFMSGGPGGMASYRMGQSFEHLLQPDMHRRDLAILAQHLQLDHNQRMVYEMLFEDYLQAFHDAAFDLARAASHMQMQQVQERTDQAIDRMTQRLREFHPAGDVVELNIGDDNTRVRMIVAPQVEAEQSDSQPADADDERTSGSVQLRAEHDDYAERQTVREIPLEVPERHPLEVPERQTLEVPERQTLREIPPHVMERIERVHEQVRERLEERLEQRREEMRQRGIDPDEEIEPIEPQELLAMARTFAGEKQRLRDRVLGDMELLLADWQQDFWPNAIQTVRRLNGLRHAQLSGEQIDLNRILDDLRLLDPDDRAQQQLLHAYNRDLDESLRRRQRFLEQADIERFEARLDDDWDHLIRSADREATYRATVREINERYADLIAEALPSDVDRLRFAQVVTDRSFPRLTRSTDAHHLFERLLEHDDPALQPEQREGINDLHEQFVQELARYERDAMQAIRDSETTRQRRMLEFIQEMRSAERRRMVPPMIEDMRVYRERAQLASQYIDQALKSLPPDVAEQFSDLRRSDRDGPRMIEFTPGRQ